MSRPGVILISILASAPLLVQAGCDSKDNGGEECTPENMCIADFPCRYFSFCRDSNTVVPCNSVPCSVMCRTDCCTGGSCSEGDPEACPESTVCLEDRRGQGHAACLPPPDDASTDTGNDGYYIPDAYSERCY